MNGAAFMTTTQAAAFLGISPRALWMLKSRGTLRESGRMGSKLLWTEADLRRQLTGDAVPLSSPVVFCCAHISSNAALASSLSRPIRASLTARISALTTDSVPRDSSVLWAPPVLSL